MPQKLDDDFGAIPFDQSYGNDDFGAEPFTSPKPHQYDPNSWFDWTVSQALKTVPAIGGAMVGSLIPGPGTVLGGMAGAGLGVGLSGLYEGRDVSPAELGVESALGGIPLIGEAPGAGAGLKAIGKYALSSAAQGGFQGLAGSVPRHIAETGNWELPPLNEALSQGAGGALFGGAMGLGHGVLASQFGTPEFAPSDQPIKDVTPPRSHAFLSNEYEEIPRQFSDDLRGVRQANLFPSEPGAREVRGTEPYFSQVGGERESQSANEPYFYQYGPQQLNLDAQPELGMNEYPMMMRKSAPVEAAPVEVNPVSPEPQVSTGEELPPTVSIVNALKEAPYWKEKGYVGVGIGADGHPIMARPDVAPLYKQEALKTESTVSDKAYAVAGETVEYPAAKATPKLIQNMLKNGYKMISKDNIKATFKRLAEDETGSLDLESLRRSLKAMFGREPSSQEVQQAAFHQRELEPKAIGEKGRVAEFDSSAPPPDPTVLDRRTIETSTPDTIENILDYWRNELYRSGDPHSAQMFELAAQKRIDLRNPPNEMSQGKSGTGSPPPKLEGIFDAAAAEVTKETNLNTLNEYKQHTISALNYLLKSGDDTERTLNREMLNLIENRIQEISNPSKTRPENPRNVIGWLDDPVPSREGQQELALGPSSELVPRELPQDANLYPSNESIPKGKQPVQEKLPIQETPNLKSIDKAITDTWDELQRTLKREPTIAEFDAAIKAKGIELPPIRGGSGETGEPPISGAKKKKQPSLLRQWFNLSRGLTTPLDLSDPLRQGSPLVFTKAWRDSWGPRLKALGSEGAYQKTISDIEARPLFKSHFDGEGNRIPSWAEVHGFKLADLHASREEATPSNWAESGEFLNKIPGAAKTYKETMGRGVRATDRAYTAGQNQLRADTFENLVNDAYREFQAGKKTPNPFENAKFTREIIDYVDTVTGRAPMKLARPTYDRETGKWSLKESNFEQHAQAITDVMFSPRLTFSRMRMLNPMTYAMASPFVRKQYLKSLISLAGFWGTIATTAALAGAEVSTDSNSADFMKIKIGNTRLDPGAGFQQYIVAASRLISGHTTSSASGRDFELGQGYRPPTRVDIMQNFAANKLHPVVKFAYDMANASQHQPFPVADRTTQLFIPLIFGDVLDLAKEDPRLLPLIAPIALGMGSQTYSKGETQNKFIPQEYDWNFTGGELFGGGK